MENVFENWDKVFYLSFPILITKRHRCVFKWRESIWVMWAPIWGLWQIISFQTILTDIEPICMPKGI